MRLLLSVIILNLTATCGSRDDKKPTAPEEEITRLVDKRWTVREGKIYSPEGVQFRAVGANLTNLMGRDKDFVRQRVEREARMGFSFIRLWTPNHNSTGPADMNARADQVLKAMDEIAAHNMKAMVVLWDTYKDLWGQGVSYHNLPEWWRAGYRSDFLKWVSVISKKLKDHPALFMYQLMNEGSCRKDCANDYINMYLDSAKLIRSVDSKPLISPGGLSLTHSIAGGSFGGSRTEFIKKMLESDDQIVWTNSIYNHEAPNIEDLNYSLSNKLPVIVTEYGFCVNGNENAFSPLGKFMDKTYGAKALFDRWQVAGITAWEATESNCGYANAKVQKFNLGAQFRELNRQINRR